VERLGAQAYFLDAAEHDGLMAAVDHLPALLAAVLLHSTTGSNSWRDMQRLAGVQYETSTQFASETPAVFRDAFLHNRDNVIHWIDSFIGELQGWKQIIADGDAEQLEAAFEEATTARMQWLQQRKSQRWEDTSRPDVPKPPGFLHSLFGLGGRASR
jgi:prephenate dehydrogenase